MSEKDNNVMPLATDPHNLGEFDNVYDAMRRYPNGGVDGDYIYILGVQHFWNVNRQSWGILKDKEDNLVQMVEDFIGLFERKGYVFAGYALPDTTPVSGLDNIFYIAAKNGVYTHFGSDLKLLNEVAILRKPRRSSIWIKDSMDIPNSERIDAIDDAISRINVDIKTIKSAIIGMENDLDGVHDSIDDINKDIDAFKKETSENFEEVNSDLDKVEKRLDYIPKESFLSARPAGFKPDIDLTPETTVDRAWRDHEGNVIRDTYITRRGLRNEIIDITNQQVTDLKPGSVDPDDLSEATKQLIGNKSITNLPDEEDITVTENQTLKLKDKEYAPKDYSGMGRVYLRKHYVNGVNTLTQHMMRKPNTIYIIQYDYCLAEQTIEVPENCVLQFEGGSLRNGTIVGNRTLINANAVDYIFNNVTVYGLIAPESYLQWFANDFSEKSGQTNIAYSNARRISTNVTLLVGDYYVTSPIVISSSTTLKGQSKFTRIIAAKEMEAVIQIGNGGNSSVNGAEVSKLLVNGNGKATIGIKCWYISDNSIVRDLSIRDCIGAGLWVSKVWYANFDNIRTWYNGIGIEIGAGTGDTAVNGINFNSISCMLNSKHSLKLSHGSAMKFDSCTFENTSGDSEIYIRDSDQAIIFDNCYVETSKQIFDVQPAYNGGCEIIIIGGIYITSLAQGHAAVFGNINNLSIIGSMWSLRAPSVSMNPVIQTKAINNYIFSSVPSRTGSPSFNDDANIYGYGNRNDWSQTYKGAFATKQLQSPSLRALSSESVLDSSTAELLIGAYEISNVSNDYGMFRLKLCLNKADQSIDFYIQKRKENSIIETKVMSIGQWGDVNILTRVSGLIFSAKGTTSERPAYSINHIGGMYFDTDLGKPIWMKEKNIWVDATGTVV